MSVAQQQRFLSIGEIAIHVRVLEARLRRFLTDQPYVIRVGRARGVSEDDLPALIADLKAAGLMPVEETVGA